MLRKFRRLRLAQIALAIASVLAVTGSLGLHPEPGVRISRPAADGLAQWETPQAPDNAAHDCPACLAQRSLSIPRLAGVILQAGTRVAIASRPPVERPVPAPARTYAGRAPPASA